MKKVFLMVMLLCLSVEVFAQNTFVSLNVGGSKLEGEEADYYKTGYYAGLNIMGEISPNFLLGVNLGYSRISVDSDKCINAGEAEGFTVYSCEGSGTALQALVSIRLRTQEADGFSLFLQAGVGMYFARQNIEMVVDFLGSPVPFGTDESQDKPGISIGGGISLGSTENFQFEIFPQYHIIFTDDENSKYWTFSLGIAF